MSRVQRSPRSYSLPCPEINGEITPPVVYPAEYIAAYDRRDLGVVEADHHRVRHPAHILLGNGAKPVHECGIGYEVRSWEPGAQKGWQ